MSRQTDEPTGMLLRLPKSHAVFDGHFPQAPVAPAAWLLQQVLQRLRQADIIGHSAAYEIRNAKFFAPCRPQDSLRFFYQTAANGAILLRLERDAQRVMQAELVMCN